MWETEIVGLLVYSTWPRPVTSEYSREPDALVAH
jgi:hypothetical protein